MNAFKRFGLVCIPLAFVCFISIIQFFPEQSAWVDKHGAWPYVLGALVSGALFVWQLIVVIKNSNN